jgi:hypothetical protein
MRRRVSLLAAVATLAVTFIFPSLAAAHNRALLWLPTGECLQVGSLKSVSPGPDKTTLLDLRPETSPADEIGTAFAADEGNSKLEKGACPS